MTQKAQQDPRSKHYDDDMPAHEDVGQPGHTSQTDPTPDHGEESYVGAARLRGKKALITGGDSGIGRAVAAAYAREGADVAIVHLPQEHDDAQTTLGLIREAGRQGVTYAQDLTEDGAAEEVVSAAVADLGGLDVVVLNAAVQRARSRFEDTPMSEIKKVIDTNLISHIAVAQAAVPHLGPGSSIITTTSIQAAGPAPPLFDYAMTKAAQVSFIEVLGMELGERGIRVNGVAPGPIWTPLIPGTNFPEGKVQHFGQDTPLGRPGQPAELAGAYVYLASEEASYTAGAVIPVTGGKPFTGG